MTNNLLQKTARDKYDTPPPFIIPITNYFIEKKISISIKKSHDEQEKYKEEIVIENFLINKNKLSILEYLYNLPETLNFDYNIDNFTSINASHNNFSDLSYIINQRKFGFTHALDKYPILSTFGLSSCICIIIYDKIKKNGYLSHIDDMTKFDSLFNIRNYFNFKNTNDIDIYLVGGIDNEYLILMIYQIFDMLKITKLIKKTNLNSKHKYPIVSIDTRTGEIGILLNQNYKFLNIINFNACIESPLEKDYIATNI